MKIPLFFLKKRNKIMKYILTAHAIERTQRANFIIEKIGWGEVIGIFPHESNSERTYRITDTGIAFVVTKKNEVITFFPLTVAKADAIYHGNVPKKLVKVIVKNNQMYSNLW